MIDLLLEYARNRGLVTEPGFTPKTVRWALAFTHDGRFLGVLPLGDPEAGRRPGREFPCCPYLTQPELIRCQGCHFLVESAGVVALLGAEAPAGDTAQQEPQQGTRRKHDFFVRLLEEASEAMPSLAGPARILKDEERLATVRAQLEAAGARPGDAVTLRVGETFPVESTAWHDWWRKWRQRLYESGEGRRKEQPGGMVCFATGQVVAPAATHPKISGLADVGGMAMGSTLVSFDKAAFPSYGLKQSASAAMSAEAAAAYRAALNDLIQKNSDRLAGTRIVYWYSCDVPREDDPLALLRDPRQNEEEQAQKELVALERARRMLAAIRSGKRPELLHARYYSLALSGSGGRVMVRDWQHGSFEQLVEGVEAWFADLAIGAWHGGGLASPPGMERVVTALLPPRRSAQNYDDWVRPVGAAREALWRAALRKDAPIPYSVLARVVLAHRTFVETGALEEALQNGRDAGLMISLLHARMGLIRAYHRRQAPGGNAMTEYLNEEHPEPAYHCGRLLAVLARLQEAALKDVRAGVVQRFYAAASTTPGLVLGRLIRTSNFHLDKLEEPLSRRYQDQIAEIWSRIRQNPPRTLTLEEQSLFAMGYYQQLAHDNQRRREAAAKKRAADATGHDAANQAAGDAERQENPND